ncbi:MAG: response regulator [Syntrophobacteraceae bacterium]
MKRILVIEDDEQYRPMLTRMLQRAGYEVAAAADGEEGIRLFRLQPADLVISDIFMPGKEGMETIRELHRDYPDLKIIAMSGGNIQMGPFCSLPPAKEFGAVEVLSKPFEKETLLKTVRDVLGGE